ncbi:MAG: hypothetical protein QCI00_05345 [Candidatus Thermoplasmatota archaeon]|nr:hypothetical protein [Candidatus Thermoplasmatota archaeon]
MNRNDRLFSASELGQYTFCSVSWYLKRQGHKSPSSKKKSHGVLVHDEIGRKMLRSQWLIRLSYIFIVCASLLLLFLALTLWFNITVW